MDVQVATADLSRQPARRRLASIDIARGLALLAMAVYHLAWDLEYFGYADPGLTAEGGWKWFARTIASSFLFLAGVSLVLGHYPVIRWKKFFRRVAWIAAAAAAITAATLYAMPERFIFFGILHSIAAGYLVGTLFVGRPPALTAAAGLFALLVPHLFRHPFFDQPLLLWTGLGVDPPLSNDYVPLFPWIGPLLLGIAAARWARIWEWTPAAPAAGFPWDAGARTLVFAGRNSLTFYLLHQPVLIASVWLFSQVVPPPAADRALLYDRACEARCTSAGGDASCSAFCRCTREEMQGAGLFDRFYDGELPATDPEIAGIVAGCNALPPARQ